MVYLTNLIQRLKSHHSIRQVVQQMHRMKRSYMIGS